MKKHYTPSDKVEYLAIPTRRLFIFLFVTVGFYSVYWFYQNWKAIKVADQSKISPFWRMLFTIIWVYPLFKRIQTSADKQGHAKRYLPAILAVSYIASCLIYTALSLVLVTTWLLVAIITYSIVTALLIVIAQKAANYNNARLGFVTALGRKTTKNEAIIVIAGIIVTIVSVVATWSQPPATQQFSETKRQIEGWGRLKAESDALLAQYDECADALNARHKTLDTSSQVAVDAYNADVDACEDIRLRQNEAADKYQAAVGR